MNLCTRFNVTLAGLLFAALATVTKELHGVRLDLSIRFDPFFKRSRVMNQLIRDWLERKQR